MNIHNQRGQFVIEAVLLMTLFMGLLILGVRTFREGKVLPSLVEAPWGKTAGMIEAGSWLPVNDARTRHPNQFQRAFTPREQ